MGIDYEKLDKLAAAVTFISVFFAYMVTSIALIIVVWILCKITNLNFYSFGKAVYLLWTFVFLIIVWKDWDEYYSHSRKTIYDKYANMLDENDDTQKRK